MEDRTMHSPTSRRYGVLTLASVLALVAGCAVTDPSAYRNRDEPINRTTGVGQEYRGTVQRVDQPQRVVILDNGQMYRLDEGQTVIVNGRAVSLGQVAPGTPVTIVSGVPVVYQNGQYVAVAPGSTVAAAPAGTIVAAPANRGVVRMYGHVTDIDRDGTVKVRLLDGDTVEFRAPSGTVTRQGDPVTIDMTFGAPAPSALPR
jgi:hypothetical protein